MSFRLRLFALHLLASATVLALVLGCLYLGWYRWPGWYLAVARNVFLLLAGVDLVLGPCLTAIVASTKKPRRELARDIGIIAAVQLIALAYGTYSLWEGRPLYYAFSENMLELVQAYDIDPDEWSLAQRRNPALAPHWYSRPRWIWAPLPENPAERDRILRAAITGETDVINMPRYFHPWQSGASALREQLQPVASIRFLGSDEKRRIEQRMRQAGLDPERANAIIFMGRTARLVAVFDPDTLRLLTLLGVGR